VARPEERKFLGFSISNDGSERRIAPNALDKFKTQIRYLIPESLCPESLTSNIVDFVTNS
jgi:hypothetical protein